LEGSTETVRLFAEPSDAGFSAPRLHRALPAMADGVRPAAMADGGRPHEIAEALRRRGKATLACPYGFSQCFECFGDIRQHWKRNQTD